MQTTDNYKALAFFDLDGTLLNSQSRLDSEVIEALAHLRTNGILPFIATGRGYFELSQMMAESGITGAISLNGQYIMLDKKLLYKESIPIQIATKLLSAAEADNEALAFYDGTHCWLSALTEHAKKAYAYLHGGLPHVARGAYQTQEVNMLLVLTDKLSQVAHYKSIVPELNFFMNSPNSIDVTNSTTTKGTGVRRVMEALNFNGPTYAFGDGRNDLDLLAACDHTTAMGNAVPELKEIADFISTANTHHGIVNAFKHWNLF